MGMANDYAAQNALDVESMLTCIPIYKYAIDKTSLFVDKWTQHKLYNMHTKKG